MRDAADKSGKIGKTMVDSRFPLSALFARSEFEAQETIIACHTKLCDQSRLRGAMKQPASGRLSGSKITGRDIGNANHNHE
jgi:hypothetical protein